MITGSPQRGPGRLPPSPGLEKALEFLRGRDLRSLPDGRHEIDGGRVFALAQRYDTEKQAGEPRFEAHRKFIDVQYIAEGEEIIGWAPLERLDVTEPYDADKDVCFGAARGWSPVRLQAGELAVFFPEDAHAPKMAAGAPSRVFKIVVKVAAE